MIVLDLMGIKVALNTITPTVSLMTDYSVLFGPIKLVYPPFSFSLTFVFIEMLVTSQESERSSCICV